MYVSEQIVMHDDDDMNKKKLKINEQKKVKRHQSLDRFNYVFFNGCLVKFYGKSWSSVWRHDERLEEKEWEEERKKIIDK